MQRLTDEEKRIWDIWRNTTEEERKEMFREVIELEKQKKEMMK